MTKAILFIWIGFSHGENMSMTKFDTIAECEAARAAIVDFNSHRLDLAICLPYTFSQ